MTYEFTVNHKQRFKDQGSGHAAWIAPTPANATKQVKTIRGLSIEVCAASSEPQKVAANKLATLDKAIEVLQTAEIMFRAADVKKFRAVFYGGNGDTLPSRGMVYFEDVSDAKPCVLLQLGNRLSKHVTNDLQATQVVDGIRIVGGARQRPPRVIADRIYDYYKPALTVSAKEKCALNQALHELGHVIHQLHSPDDYWLNAEVAGGQDAMATLMRHNEFNAIKECGLKYVSQYAGIDAKSLNEYVAEVFAGMLMGIPWNEIDPSRKLMTTYVSLGGPVPPNVPWPISRLSDFTRAACTCTANDHGEALKYW